MNSQSLKTVQVFDLLWNFLQKSESMKHVDSVHENEDSCNCMVCDKSFSHKCNLKYMLKKFVRFDQPCKKQKPMLKKSWFQTVR